MDIVNNKDVRLRKLKKDYTLIEPFKNSHKKLTYLQLDYSFVNDLILFTIDPNFNFENLEAKIDKIIAAMPSLKTIFAKPFIHLKEEDKILPIEAVRVINNNSIQHISSHTELWSDVDKKGVKPLKLMTLSYIDNYGIYENLVFCNVIDEILSFTRTNISYLKELLYTNQSIEFNLLERLNHLSYFLAIGKLHTGYSRNFDSYYAISLRCLNKLQFISNILKPRLKRPVYANNKVRPKTIKLHKTNILGMQKEYRQVYKLAKMFEQDQILAKEENDYDPIALQGDYFIFCELLIVFSIMHFNFTVDQDVLFDFDNLDVTFNFKKWTLNLKRLSTKDHDSLIELTITKDTKYKIVILPSISDDSFETLKKIRKHYIANEFVLFNPFEENKHKATFINITNLDSFRRIQRIILHGMIYCDSQREDCPFCNNKLELDLDLSSEDRPVYVCPSCRTEIHLAVCPTKKRKYYYTKISNYNVPTFEDEKDSWLKNRKIEALMYYRNITKIDEEGNIICPFCGKIHEH